MPLSAWFGRVTDHSANPEFFARSPFRSYYFACNTGMLACLLAYTIIICFRYPELRRYPGAGWVMIVIGGALAPWIMAFRNHQKLQRLQRSRPVNDLPPGSLLHVALGVAAQMTHFGLFYAYLLTLAAFQLLALTLHANYGH